MLFQKVEQFLKKNNEKKIIIYGAGSIGKVLSGTLRSFNKEIAYFVDGDKNKQGTKFWGSEVKSPYDLMYENPDEIAILLGLSAQDEVIKVLESMGFVENEHFDCLDKIETDKPTDVFDPFLGFSRMDDMEGFAFFGNKNAEVTILTLGGSTTDYSMSELKSWPYYLQKEHEKNGISCRVINGGIGGYYSAQEMLKLIRDGLYLEPNIVISYSGINDALGVYCDTRYPMISNYLKNTVNNLPVTNKKIGFGMEKQITRYKNWERNIRTMYAVCKEFDSKFYSFLQPYIFSGAYVFDQREKILFAEMHSLEEQDSVRKFYDEAKKGIGMYPYMHDFTQIFDGLSGIYYDSAHCNEEGNQIIAKRIYEVIQTEKERQ